MREMSLPTFGLRRFATLLVVGAALMATLLVPAAAARGAPANVTVVLVHGASASPRAAGRRSRSVWRKPDTPPLRRGWTFMG